VLETLVLEDPAAAAAERLATVVAGGGRVALAGGSTPRTAYEHLAAMGIDWSRCTLWFGDERCVPPDDWRSNFGMVRAALLDRLSGAGPAVRRIAGELGPHRGADAYERDLRDEFGSTAPALDLVLLGVGSDAHCASLFPGHPALDEHERFAVGIERPSLEPWVPRITLTLPVINAAREVVFLVAGTDKADAVARAFASPPSRFAPASLVAPFSGSLTLLVDRNAAARLHLDAAAHDQANPGP
jgi:6-phosphogluconolactonase